MKATHSIWLVLCFVAAGCVEPYKPELAENNPEYLVIDGFLDVDHGNALVELRRTASLNSSGISALEKGADVKIENSAGTQLQLPEVSTGRYQLTGNTFSYDMSYRLIIVTANQKTYQSSFVKPVVTPLIDSVSWKTDGDLLHVNVTTIGTPDESRFFRFQFIETYEYHAPYLSPYRIVEGIVVPRLVDELVYWCWKSDTLKDIKIANTSSLSENIIRDYNLVSIPKGSIELSRRYSILVKQQALSADAYDYWLNIQKVNQELGGLYDPQPGRVNGNIYCLSNPDEPAIGLFEAGGMQEKRIFIDVLDLPGGFGAYRYPECFIDTIYIEDIPLAPNMNLIEEFYVYGMGLPYVYCFTTSGDNCTDCRTFGGGDIKRPDFWKD